MSAALSDPPADPPVAGKLCPICGKPVDTEYFPFCSKRCADRDHHRWLGGHYAIPGEAAGEDEEAPNGKGDDG